MEIEWTILIEIIKNENGNEIIVNRIRRIEIEIEISKGVPTSLERVQIFVHLFKSHKFSNVLNRRGTLKQAYHFLNGNSDLNISSDSYAI